MHLRFRGEAPDSGLLTHITGRLSEPFPVEKEADRLSWVTESSIGGHCPDHLCGNRVSIRKQSKDAARERRREIYKERERND
ncbi:UNVERIFIED_CONTAM: hypothetical protein PYX00_005778 [Menopon gallinae]|uniref:Uncharacterized protein n=1 Tax=Menopon gallinae TaxID=328185 RepID=A0AAW2HU26_9NEOP